MPSDATDLEGFANSATYDIGDLKWRVTMTTLEAICNGVLPEVVKIDVEGAQPLVLHGADKLLSRAAPNFRIAVHTTPMRTKATPADLVALFKTRCYDRYHLDGRPSIDPEFEEIVFEKRAAKLSREWPFTAS